MPALSHGWWKGWRGPKPLTADFRDRGRGFNVLSVYPPVTSTPAITTPVIARDPGELAGYSRASPWGLLLVARPESAAQLLLSNIHSRGRPFTQQSKIGIATIQIAENRRNLGALIVGDPGCATQAYPQPTASIRRSAQLFEQHNFH